VDVGETACQAAVRETAEEAGVRVLITGLAGTFTDPTHVIRSPGGEVRQVFALLFRARALGGVPHGDQHETSEAAWVTFADLDRLVIAPPTRTWIEQALDINADPYLG
jgi:8-oxo-dGTP pyrophosphatase MutT (NUDIX family)